MPITALRLLAVLIPILGLLAGCGKPLAETVEVTGKVTFPPGLKLNDNDTTTVTFLPEGSSTAQGGSGTFSGATGTFTAKVPPGSYKVAVNVSPYPGEKKSDDRKNEFTKAIGKYGIPTTVGGSKQPPANPIPYEVANTPTQAITIDLVKGTITKN